MLQVKQGRSENGQVTEMPSWVQSTPDFVRYFLESNYYYYYNNMCGSEKTESRHDAVLCHVERHRQRARRFTTHQENIYLVEFSAEYEDVGSQRETAIFFYEEDHDNSKKYGYVLFEDALKDLIEID